MKTIFLNPHVADFCYRPVSFVVARRRALCKYAYLDQQFGKTLFFTPGATSLPGSWSAKFSDFVKRPFSVSEARVWSRINERPLRPITADVLSDNNVFLFGYKTGPETLEFLRKRGFKNRVFLHLSHYHTFKISREYFKDLDVVLLFDTDISDHPYFRKRFPDYKRSVQIIPFQIGNRFFAQDTQAKLPRIAVTGTYHRLPNGALDIDLNGTATLHPSRLAFAERDIQHEHVANHLSLFKSQSMLSVFRGQSKYMKFDIAELYKTSSHAFVGVEGTGAIAIGTLEAMAAGCIPFVTGAELRGALFDPADAMIEYYGDIDDLCNKIAAFDMVQPVAPVMANVDSVRVYLSENLTKIAASLFEERKADP